MQGIIWQQSSTKPENLSNFALISQWWSSLANKEISFAQRMIPQSGEVDELNWEPQRFDEAFELKKPKFAALPFIGANPILSRSATPRLIN